MTIEIGEYYGIEVEVIRSKPIGEYYDLLTIRRTDGRPFVYEVGGADDGPSYTTTSMTLWVAAEYVKNRRVEEIPDDLPIPADPREDEVLDGERLADEAWYRQQNFTYLQGMGG